jgi:hypothetical protein
MVQQGAANNTACSGVNGGGSCHNTSLPLRRVTHASRRMGDVVVSSGVQEEPSGTTLLRMKKRIFPLSPLTGGGH